MLHVLLAALVIAAAAPVPESAVDALARSLPENDVVRAYGAIYADANGETKRVFVA
jgi:hypothetical protein